MSRRSTNLAIAVVAGAQLMITLDLTIVNVALPSIHTALHFSPSSLAWVVNAYTLVFVGPPPPWRSLWGPLWPP